MSGKKETTAAFFTNGSFDLFSSSSREPSSTIKINPTVPSKGNNDERSGTDTEKKTVNCLSIQPNSNKRITVGILVLAELISKRYASNISTHKVMMIDVVMLFAI